MYTYHSISENVETQGTWGLLAIQSSGIGGFQAQWEALSAKEK